MKTETVDSFDTLEVLLANIGKRMERITTNDRIIHCEIHKLASDERYKRFFSKYHFREIIGGFYSEELDQDLMNFQFLGYLSAVGPWLREMILTGDLKESAEKVKKNFSQQDLKTITEMSYLIFNDKRQNNKRKA